MFIAVVQMVGAQVKAALSLYQFCDDTLSEGRKTQTRIARLQTTLVFKKMINARADHTR